MSEEITVAELFAGVGGFRLGLDGYHSEEHPEFDMPASGPFKTIWANQWEPPGTKTRQFAARCYEARFGEGSVVVEDINKVLDEVSQAGGIEGKKGVLWWDIYRFLQIQISKSPDNAKLCLFENVDRLLKSPASQRGRDFAIILSCLATLGYSVEWQVINSGAYGFPQRRKRIYIYAERSAGWNLEGRLFDGVIARAFPIARQEDVFQVAVPADPYEATMHFNEQRLKRSPFRGRGVMVGNTALTCDVEEAYAGRLGCLGDVLVPESEVPEEFFVPEEQLSRWEYLKGAKREKRVNKKTGFEYMYSEGSMAYPDLTENPSRTILTGEGGTSPSRFKHIIRCEDGRMRRLVPDELDQLQCFPKGWTDTGMTDGHRAFCMGNALVTGIPYRIGREIAKELE